MLVSLVRYQKLIAWFLMGLIYLEFLLIPIGGRAAERLPQNVQAARSYGMDLPYLRNKTNGPNSNSPASETMLSTIASDRWQATAHSPLTTDYSQLTIPHSPLTAHNSPFTTGPGQPEMSAFTSVGSANMVDLFSGDFSYNIPLLDVGGYPVNLAYRAGITMDQDASWVGLGWNVNPGTVSRNMRGLPDDFNGRYDTVRKIMSVKENKTVGVTGGTDTEVAGFPKSQQDGQKAPDSSGAGGGASVGFSLGTSLGVTYNNYRGWGLEHGINASINAGKPGMGSLSGGLSITNSSMDGLTLAPSLSARLDQIEMAENAVATGSLSLSSSYNTRSGLRSMQLGMGMSMSKTFGKNEDKNVRTLGFSSNAQAVIAFNSPSYTPTISIPYTSRQISFSGKVGFQQKVVTNSLYLSGYIASQFVAAEDTLQELPAYGYLHYTTGVQNKASLLDFNREKELPYREKPAVPHIAIPAYTYDAFSITGEGTGGMFRAYRGDIGFVYDHYMRTKDESGRLGAEVALGDLWHAGLDVNVNRVITENGPWINNNLIGRSIGFRRDSAAFQSVYFRNPGEKAINDKAFYETLGGDDVVAVGLDQRSIHSSAITAANYLWRFKNGRRAGELPINYRNARKQVRDKRTQVISYLTAQEAQVAGLSKYIEYYHLNAFDDTISCMEPVFINDPLLGEGLKRRFYKNMKLRGEVFGGIGNGLDGPVRFDFGREVPWIAPAINQDNKFSASWTGRIKAPQTGRYSFFTTSDDGVRLYINDSLIIDHWRPRVRDHGALEGKLNLEAGKMYEIRLEYFEEEGLGYIALAWKLPGQTTQDTIPRIFLFPPAAKDTYEHNNFVRELRVNRFRKASHISEVSVLNNDGRRYVYGIPVYNLQQKELTFAVAKENADPATGLVQYTPGLDNTTRNNKGRDNYYNSEEVPAYAHSFLLTGILSADYSDITGNGISDDDIGDAVKFNYTKTAGINNPYQWRTPAADSAAAYNEGLKTESRDDKGNYIYGEKELWYLHSIESKTMVAAFILEGRDDLPAYDENGNKISSHATKRLKEIRLYSKSDFMARRTGARPVKTVHFAYSYRLCPGAYGPGTGKLTLDSLWFTYNGNKKGKQNPYVFHYNSHNPAYHLQHSDRWGSYKDPAQNPGSRTGKVNRNADYPYALQDSALAAYNAAAWNLDSIRLPSGGALKVTYESDDYAWIQNKRAAQMFRILGTGLTTDYAKMTDKLYSKPAYNDAVDHRYVFIQLSRPVSNLEDLYHAYLAGIDKLYFKLSVYMPGGGTENIPCYANIEANNYGLVNSQVAWVKLAGISLSGENGGSYSPLVKAATQFIRLNLPGKAYPFSETGDAVDLEEAIGLLHGMASNIINSFKSFDRIARESYMGWQLDTGRSYIRLNNPALKKLGGGHRVKRITVYDHWDKMAKKPGQAAVKPAVYGQEYTYTAAWTVGKDSVTGSSGVAVWEPAAGAEENPFRVPVEYVEKIAPLGPVTLGYSEAPLGESFFPGASVGYSCVRVRTINYKNRKSANGWEEAKFYTAYDYPIYVDKSILDGDTKKRYKPGLANLLRINARHFLALSQGFKIELNDMHGKLRSQATYAETNPKTPVSYSEQFYRTDTTVPGFRRLANQVMVMRPDGSIDSAALIGKDLELMVDMRQQVSVTHATNVQLNTNAFLIPGVPPTFILPTGFTFLQREENCYQSAAVTKVIQRYGILDSAIQVDKGSRISTQDLLYDSETGDVLLTRTQNEFNDPVYNFTYPSHWAYEGMGLAYKNIDAVLRDVTIRDGRLLNMTAGQDSLFSSGDEILIAGRNVTSDFPGCALDQLASFPDYNKIWAIDSSVLSGGPRILFFIDRWGKPYTGDSVSLRIIRSGRRNVLGAVGSVTSLKPLLVKNTANEYELVIDGSSKVIAASAGEFRQYWKTDDVLRKQPRQECIPRPQPIGIVQCVLDNEGRNTGYQRITMVDVNPHSETYNDTSYVIRENCYECPLPAKWVVVDTFQCATDSVGNGLGFRWRGELDTASCSATSGQYRWQINAGADCAICPKPANWQWAAGDSCERNWYDSNNTGYLLRRQRDIEPCSRSYDSIRWVRDTMNCTICPRPKDWWALDSTRCEKVNGANTGYQERLEVNREQCSDSAFEFRWVRLSEQRCDICGTPPVWQPIAGDSCQKVNGVLTGYKVNSFKNISPCSDSFNMVKWVEELDCANCKKEKNWQYVSGDTCTKDANGNNTGYRVRRQQNMEPCSDSAGMYRWKTFYDPSSCDLPPTCDIYVKIRVENQVPYYGSGDHDYYILADVNAYFYSDPNHTNPVSVSNLPFQYNVYHQYIDYIGAGSYDESYVFNDIGNGHKTTLMNTRIYQNYPDPINPGSISSTDSWTYSEIGNGYICIGTSTFLQPKQGDQASIAKKDDGKGHRILKVAAKENYQDSFYSSVLSAEKYKQYMQRRMLYHFNTW